MVVFISVWPVLKSLPQMGAPVFSANSTRAGTSPDRFGGAVAVGDALDRGVGVDHRWGDVGVVVSRPFSKARQGLVDGGARAGSRSSRTRA